MPSARSRCPLNPVCGQHGLDIVPQRFVDNRRVFSGINRDKPLFEFMEPVTLELELTNISGSPQLIHDNILAHTEGMTIIVKRRGRPSRQFRPYAQYCILEHNVALLPNQNTSAALFVSAGLGGWMIDEPGYYELQIALHLNDEDVVSEPLTLRVAPPRGYDEEFLAQDLFTDESGRIIAFDGSQYFNGGNDILREITERLSDRRVVLHAHVALATPLMRDYKHLILPSDKHKYLKGAAEVGGKISISRSKIDEASKELSIALIDHVEVAAETFGHIKTEYHVDRLSRSSADHGHVKEAATAQEGLHNVLAHRGVNSEVLARISKRRDSYKIRKRQS